MKRVLVTGATGFVGSHVCELLVASGQDVYGTAFGKGNQIESLIGQDHVFKLNLLDAAEVEKVVERVKPDWVVHLAALSSPKASFADGSTTITNNVAAEYHLLEAIRKHVEGIEKILIISSAEVYGKVNHNDVPVDESVPLRPANPYAVSKIAQDYLGLQYFLTYKLPIVRLRPFNHTGERRPSTFVLPAFAEQVAKIEAGHQKPIVHVGNLNTMRDFTDVKDMARAYLLALTKTEPGEVYNIGSGKGTRLDDLLQMVLSQSSVKIEVQVDEARFKRSDVPVLIADASKFEEATGWQPEIPLEDTVRRVLEYWRNTVTKSY